MEVENLISTASRNRRNSPNYVAFSDEASYNAGRFRSLSLITMPAVALDTSMAELQQLLQSVNMTEFMWKKLGGFRERSIALQLLDWAVAQAVTTRFRVDTLIWDTYDGRHSIRGRDNIQNLHRMYHHLVHSVLSRRWPQQARQQRALWQLYPDENTAIDWQSVFYYLDFKSRKARRHNNIQASSKLRTRSRRQYRINNITPISSKEQPIVQLADLFAGLAVYSYRCYEKYKQWQFIQPGNLIGLERYRSQELMLSGVDKERCAVLHHLIRKCQRSKLGVLLDAKRGLTTVLPESPINFWLYTPQHENDKAPTR